MASQSEATFGSRLANAEKISTNLKAFTTYAPSDPDLSVAALDTLIGSLRTQNTTVQGSLSDYSAAVDSRQKLFDKNSDSLSRLLSPIGANVRAAFSKTSKEAADTASMIAKIRGVKPKKAGKDPNAVSISQSERSFGSLTQNFSDLTTMLEKYGTKYAPANPALTVSSLKSKIQALGLVNTSVTTAFGQLKEKRDNRLQGYQQLSILIQRVKDAVKGQFGPNSTEYKLVKGVAV